MESHSPHGPMAEDEDRAKAVERLKRKREFAGHVVAFLVVNAGLWVVWAVPDGADTDDLWPAWVTGIWLIILLLDAYKVYGQRPISDQRIEEEMRRMKGQ
jgi:hypothetical protein